MSKIIYPLYENCHSSKIECKAEDCISRKEMINWLTNRCIDDCNNLIDFINSMPSVYPKSDKPFDELMANYCKEHGQIIVDKDVWEDAKKVFEFKNFNKGYDAGYKDGSLVLEDIKAELQKKKLFYVHPHETAKNVYREAINDAIECINKYISGKE